MAIDSLFFCFFFCFRHCMYCCCCCCLLCSCCIWRMLLGRRWKWPSVRLNACRTFPGSAGFPADAFSLCIYIYVFFLGGWGGGAIRNGVRTGFIVVVFFISVRVYYSLTLLWKALSRIQRVFGFCFVFNGKSLHARTFPWLLINTAGK